jgi:transcriptional regulator
MTDKQIEVPGTRGRGSHKEEGAASLKRHRSLLKCHLFVRFMTEKQIEVLEDVAAMEKRLQPVLEDSRGLDQLVKERLG